MKFYYVYILRNTGNYIYIGYSENLQKRFNAHNNGLVKSTKSHVPFALIHYEAYINKQDAKRREKYLKTNRGRTTLITMLKEFFAE
ncbi:GIY-YIG nuclease family protein [Candidatus Saccharibacteria bacterium]|nr:GIY-YIG nuclease family protein [Candidatus Saccharibacteria bacterium]